MKCIFSETNYQPFETLTVHAKNGICLGNLVLITITFTFIHYASSTQISTFKYQILNNTLNIIQEEHISRLFDDYQMT